MRKTPMKWLEVRSTVQQLKEKIYSSLETFKGLSILIAFIIATSAVGVTYAAGFEITATKEAKEIYHVYIDGNYVGTVKSKDIVEETIEKKIVDYRKMTDDLEFTISNDIQIVSEVTFRPLTNEKKVINQLNQIADVAVVTQQIVVNGKGIVHLQNKEAADIALQMLQAKYEPAQLKKSNSSHDEAPVQVKFAEEVEIIESTAPISFVKEPTEAVLALQKGEDTPAPYFVKDGDAIESIAHKHNLKVKEFMALNPTLDPDDYLQIDQQVNVTKIKPIVNVVVERQVRKIEEIPYKVEYKTDPKMFKGDKKTLRSGNEGEKIVDYKVIEVNGKIQSKKAISSKTIKNPQSKIIANGSKIIPSRGTGDLIRPIYGGIVTSGFGQRWGKMHKGVDFSGAYNPSIRAADNGRVVQAGWDGGYGYKVTINHGNGMVTVYAHLSSIHVSVGQTVRQGQDIGVMGNTGDSTGTHLHFEVIINGSIRNPLNYL